MKMTAIRTYHSAINPIEGRLSAEYIVRRNGLERFEPSKEGVFARVEQERTMFARVNVLAEFAIKDGCKRRTALEPRHLAMTLEQALELSDTDYLATKEEATKYFDKIRKGHLEAKRPKRVQEYAAVVKRVTAISSVEIPAWNETLSFESNGGVAAALKKFAEAQI
eukprot:TRINITY_DN2360_c1_g1_i3.p1 TRINITY_DN2360_c1_g1~~TRINITY_DN2360_c1_g1_i3.p1  ORF type:complete len:166 (+),score=43.08 TRINITY_DN2360_c1_g1_i3:224-721(+)